MTVQGGVIQSLSASQAEEFDPDQVGGCPRRWYMHRVERLAVPESGRAQDDGDAGHALFAHWYRGYELPKRARMLKAVRGAIARGRLPPPEPGQLIESRFDGQPARDASGERVPLDVSRTLRLGGVPWDGYVDLRFYRAGMITVLDHKFSSDIHTYAKMDLLSTVQMPVYALDSLRVWPDAQHIELAHNYVSRRGVDSLYVRQLVTVAQVRQRGEEIARLVKRMQAVAVAHTADDVPANRKSCHTWTGCPFQSRCSAFKEKPKMNLSPEEMEWLNVVGGGGEMAKPNLDLDAFVAKVKAGGPVGEPAPLPESLKEKLVTSGPEADRATELEIASAAGALDDDPFAVFAPHASVPQEQPTPPVIETAVPASGAKCPDCPHPAHSGAACTGKRGRGACRCGAQGAVEKQQDAAALAGGHLPTCVENDTGKWLCMEGCTVAAGGAAVTLATANPGKPPGVVNAPETKRWSGTEPNPPGNLQREVTPLEAVRVTAMLYRQEGREEKALAAEVEALIAQVKQQQDAIDREREAHRETKRHLASAEHDCEVLAAEANRVDERVPPPSGWTGTLQVNVDLGPETLALLQRLLGGR